MPLSISSVGRSVSPYRLKTGSPVVGSFVEEIFASLRIEPRVIGNQPDVFAAKRRKLLCFENIEPGLHTRCTACALGCCMRWRGDNRGQRQKNHERKKGSKRALVSRQMVPLYSNHTMIFWNALAAFALRP